LKGFLPCYVELKRRRVMDYVTCKLCGHEDETLYHVLVNCDHTKQFWSEVSDHFRFHVFETAPCNLDAGYTGRLIP
jgi:hypothetical protein